MNALLYYITLFFLFIVNKLPFFLLYILSDLLYFVVYYVARYRRKVVRENLVNSFPSKSLKEIKSIEKKFYHRLCDFFMETVKLYGIGEKEARKRMEFVGMDKMQRSIDDGHSCVVYMGHMFNWEYMNSVSLYFDLEKVFVGEIYHPLRNIRFDELMRRVRGQFGAEPVPMKNTLRRIMQAEKEGKRFVVGFVADQLPKWEGIKHWVDFLNQDTPVFVGTEKIAQRSHAAVYYAWIERVKRGYYRVHAECLAEDASLLPEFGTTELYYKRLEANINKYPELWLWTHKRWKRTREAFEEREKRRLDTLKRRAEKNEEGA
ncbi:MAG: lysophospholipid acyltransferase family protein [Bacteroidaceae bacterium]|nr:lysophospholipid acyltransferase family protein [Bacteroidaceae bacterium]